MAHKYGADEDGDEVVVFDEQVEEEGERSPLLQPVATPVYFSSRQTSV